jgi:hypothetical protein
MQTAIFTTLDKFFNGKNLPEYLAVCKDKAYASGRIHSAAFAYLSDDFNTASHHLEEAIRLDPARQSLQETCSAIDQLGL